MIMIQYLQLVVDDLQSAIQAVQDDGELKPDLRSLQMGLAGTPNTTHVGPRHQDV